MNPNAKATTSLVLGIISVALCFFGYWSGISVILGIIGLVFANKAKKEGIQTGTRMTQVLFCLSSV